VGGGGSGVRARVGRRSGRRTEAEERKIGGGAQERDLARVSGRLGFLRRRWFCPIRGWGRAGRRSGGRTVIF
jgi:hypothetical protein